MPGLTGRVDVATGPQRDAEADVAHAVRLQLHEPDYHHRILTLPDGGAVAAIDLGLDASLSGLHHIEDLSCIVAWVGYFHEPAAGGDDSLDLARRLAGMFLERGPDALRSVDGSFVLFIQDIATGRSVLAVDHCASRPAFFHIADGRLLFAAEPHGVAGMLPQAPAISRSAVTSFLVNGHLLGQDTFFEAIRPLAPGEYVAVEAGTIRAARFWEHRFEPSDTDLGEERYGDELSGLLEDAVRRAVRRIPSLVLPLSGGFDSRGILGCLLELMPAEAIRTVTWGVDEEVEGSDARVARRLADRLGVRHAFMRRDATRLIDDVDPMLVRSQGLTNDPCIHHGELRIMQSLRRDAGAFGILRGDECFGFGGEASSDTEALRRVAIDRFSAIPALHRLFRPDVLPDSMAAYAERLSEVIDACPASDPLDRKDWFYFTQRLTNYLNRSSYYKQTVVEVVNPWLDRPILEFIGRVPRHYRIDKILYRRTLNRRFPTLFEIPMASRNSLEDWSATIARDAELQRFIRHHLLDDRNRFHDLFDPAAIAELLDRVQRPAPRPSLRDRATAAAKSLLARWPRAYRHIKARMIDRVPAAAPPAGETLLRLLQLKLWFGSGIGGASGGPAAQRHETPSSSASAP